VSASGAGSLGSDSPGADGSGAGVAVAGFDLRGAALADLIKQIQLSYKSKRAEADGAVPATATVIVAEAAGSVPISWSSGLGGEAGGLQMENVSMQQY
jgi:hypothetical protein